MPDHNTRFKDFLELRGLKLTRSRKLILDAAFELHEHFDAEKLHSSLKGLNVSLATVYRTLPLLLDAGLIQLAMRSEGRDRFEHILGHPRHVHWICENCKQVFETNLDELVPRIEVAAKAQKFEINHINISISGLCWKCRINANESQ
ncbi:MAG: Fur family transcriptional regulator [Candidatus Cloacimonetes bacterium]|nr:Fur family transcriptional regulator [Candidatus Cloacimonadota bacterium]